MIIDNFDLIAEHMTFDSSDDFYFVQILIRGKDGHHVNGSNKNRLIKFYTIKSIEDFKNKKEDIVKLCNIFNARAYIHPTKRSFEEVAKITVKENIEAFITKQYDIMKRIYSTACGKSFNNKDKKFVIDIDFNPAFTEYGNREIVSSIMNYINKECEPLNEFKIEYEVPTLNGIHFITKPFNTARFNEKFPDIAVQKNNPTLLYYNKQDGQI